MKSISGKEFAKILERHGWEPLRVQGSHHIYGNLEARFGFPFQFIVIRVSKPDYFVTS